MFLGKWVWFLLIAALIVIFYGDKMHGLKDKLLDMAKKTGKKLQEAGKAYEEKVCSQMTKDVKQEPKEKESEDKET